MTSRTKMVLCLRKAQIHKISSNFSFAGDRHLISYFCIIIILANVNFAYSYASEINITINGTGKQLILSNYSGDGIFSTRGFNLLPNETLVNGVPQSSNDKYVDNLVNQTNIITLRWYYQVTTCSRMFYDLNNITIIDLSNFDTSKVKSFLYMFYNCTSLKSINLNNVKTSSAESLHGMFGKCSGLKILNLSSFDTSKVTDMGAMFYHCESLKSLDLSNFKTPELIETIQMFHSCYSLVLLNLINFNTSKVSDSRWMFDDANERLIYCANESTIAEIKSSSAHSFIGDYTNNCKHSCFLNSKYKYIIEKNECIDDCSKDKNYSYEYNNNCYKSCPTRTHISPNNDYLCEDLICPKYYNYGETECLGEIPEGFYLNDSNHKTLDKCDIKCKNCSFESTMQEKCISCNISAGYYPLYNNDSNNETFISCYNESIQGYALFNYSYIPCFRRTCHICSEIGDKNNNKCIICKSNYEFKEEMNETPNCYEKCDNDSYYYFDEFNNYYCIKECPHEYNKLIKEKGKCIDDCSKDKLYRFEYNNICYSTYPEITTIDSTSIEND